jgi:hypothetical protein
MLDNMGLNDAAAGEEEARHEVLFKHDKRTKALHQRSLDDEDVLIFAQNILTSRVQQRPMMILMI